MLFCLHRGAPQTARVSACDKRDRISFYTLYKNTHRSAQLKFQAHTPSIIFIKCVNCDSMKEQDHEAVTDLKWLRLINKLLFEKINK